VFAFMRACQELLDTLEDASLPAGGHDIAVSFQFRSGPVNHGVSIPACLPAPLGLPQEAQELVLLLLPDWERPSLLC